MDLHEMKARTRKALRMADVADAHGLNAESLQFINDEGWESLAKAAGCKPPSGQETKDAVIRMLGARGICEVLTLGLKVRINDTPLHVRVRGARKDLARLKSTLWAAVKEGRIKSFEMAASVSDSFRPMRECDYMQEWIDDLGKEEEMDALAGGWQTPGRFCE